MKEVVLGFWKDESGQDMAEYALLLALIALVLVVTVTAFRGAIQAKFQQAATELSTAGS
jgi:Flp pilus assembly pilin Flp